MELGKYKRALKASTRPKHLRRVVYQPEIVDLDVDFPSADQPFNRFAEGGLAKDIQNFLIQSFPNVDLNFTEKNKYGFPREKNIALYTKIRDAALRKTKNKDYVYTPVGTDLESLEYKKGYGTGKQLIAKAKEKGIYVSDSTLASIFANNFKIPSEQNPKKGGRDKIYDLSVLDDDAFVEKIQRAQVSAGRATPEATEKFLSKDIKKAKKRKTQSIREAAEKAKGGVKDAFKGTRISGVEKGHMNDLFSQYITGQNLGYVPKDINKEIGKKGGIDDKMRALYKKRERLLKEKPKNLKTELENINIKGARLAGQSGGFKTFTIMDPVSQKTYEFGGKRFQLDPTNQFPGMTEREIVDFIKNADPNDFDAQLKIKMFEDNRKATLDTVSKQSPELIEKFKNNLSKIDAQTATNAVANLACPGQYADGGRVKFSRGSECYAKGLQLLDDAKFGDEKAKAKVAKGMKALKILGGVGAEILFETAFLLPSIAEGKPLDVLIGESTLGYLGLGTSEDEKTIEMSGNDPRVIRYIAAKRAYEDNKQIPLQQEQMVPGLDEEGDLYQNLEDRKKANRAVYEKFVRSNDRDIAAAAHKLAQKKKQESYDENKKGLPARTAQAILNALQKTFIGDTQPGEVFDLPEFQDGGRVGFENGGFTRRGFLKALGALAAVIAGLRTGKGTKVVPKTTTAKQVVENAGKGTPEWFAPLVDKIKTEGIDVPAENVARTSGRESVTKLEVKNPESNTTDSYYLFENSDTGEVRIDVDALGVGANDGEFSLYMRPRRVEGLTDEGIQQIDEGEFFVTEDRAVGRMSGPDDYEMDLEALDTDLSGSASNWHQLEEFATGKTDKAAQTEQLKKKDFIERNPGDDIENRYGVYDPPEPDDYD